jgi:protein gp37
MSTANTSIEWTGRTWNPVRGCSLVSPGCTHCYAMALAHRFSGAGKPYEGLTRKRVSLGAVWTGEVRTVPDALDEPLSWRTPTRVFVNSMSDLFHGDVPDAFIAAVFGIMAMSREHTFQVLTKRPERMRAWFAWITAQAQTGDEVAYCVESASELLHGHAVDVEAAVRRTDRHVPVLGAGWPLANVHLGVSVEDRKHGVPRIATLREVPAALRFLSVEPLLEDVGDLDLTGIGWVIVGGESGPHARRCDLGWIHRVVTQCRAQRVPCFVKQLGARPTGEWLSGRAPQTHHHPARRDEWVLNDAKGGDPGEWPTELRVREMPEVRHA